MYQDTSIEMLQKRGLIMRTCLAAVEERSRGLVKEDLRLRKFRQKMSPPTFSPISWPER
jgi:hypothetical protein